MSSHMEISGTVRGGLSVMSWETSPQSWSSYTITLPKEGWRPAQTPAHCATEDLLVSHGKEKQRAVGKRRQMRLLGLFKGLAVDFPLPLSNSLSLKSVLSRRGFISVLRIDSSIDERMGRRMDEWMDRWAHE